jgi:hypothetical protein
MTANLRSHEYGDPLEILIKREASTCKGCQFIGVVFDRQYCTKGKKYGKRCSIYIERGRDGQN